MKRAFITLVILIVCGFTSVLSAQTTSGISTQRIGYINTDSILVKIPAYVSAVKELDRLSNEYQKKIESEVKKIETLYQNYQSQKARLSESEKARREQEIIDKEKEVKKLQQTYFGQDGYMNKKSDELLKPIREKVQQAIDKVAELGKFMIIFDIAAIQGVAYYAPGDNLNSYVLRLLRL